MKGLTALSTSAIDIGLANAPSGVGVIFSSEFSVAACRASTV
jgi:hypothetical protein